MTPSPISAGGVRALFFSYFAFIGALSPYAALYFAARGLSIVEIGVLMALPQALRIVAPAFWAWLADRSGRRVALLRVSAAIAVATMLLFPAAGGAPGLGALMLVLFFATAAQLPIAEAMALHVSRGDAGRYGRLRLWGSVGFILAVMMLGPVLDRLGVLALPWLLAAILALLLAVTLRLPASEAPAAPPRAGRVRERLREPQVVLFFASAFLMIFAHAAFYAFFSLLLAQHGYSKSAIGALWALGVVAEIALFMLQARLFARFDAMALLGFCFVVCAVRFALIGGAGGWLPALVLAQLMHAITFGLHHSASMAVLHAWFPPWQQARAQAALIVVAYGLGGTGGALAASWIWVGISPAAAFYGAAISAAGGWVAIVFARRLGYARASFRTGASEE